MITNDQDLRNNYKRFFDFFHYYDRVFQTYAILSITLYFQKSKMLIACVINVKMYKIIEQSL